MEVLATNEAIRTSARETALATSEAAKFSRGALEATGSFGKFGAALALGSGGFIAGAGAVAGLKAVYDAGKNLLDNEEQLRVAVRNTNQEFDARQIDKYLKAESALSLFTKSDLTGALVGLERATGSVTKAETDEALAANIARGAHIDLATATQDLIRLEAGRTRGLATLGVKIPIVKTATDALTASHLVFTGQQKAEAAAIDKNATAMQGIALLTKKYGDSAKTYGDSSASSIDKLHVAVNSLEVSASTALLPTIQSLAAPFAAWAQKEADSGDAAGKVRDAIKGLTQIVNTGKAAIHDIDEVTGGFKHTLLLLAGLKLAEWAGAVEKSLLTVIGSGSAATGLKGAEVAAGGLAGKLAKLKTFSGMVVTAAVIEGVIANPGKTNKYDTWSMSGLEHGFGLGSASTYSNLFGSSNKYQSGNGASSTGLTGSGSTNQALNEHLHGGGNTSSGRQKLINFAMSMLGTPYAWGGTGPGGFDCSGLVQWAFGQSGVSLPHVTTDQFKQGKAVSLGNIKPGDVVFTEPGKGPGGGPGHEGLYAGNGQVIEAPHTGDKVKTVSLKSFLSGGLVGIRDFMGGTGADAGTAAQIAALLKHGKPKPPSTVHGVNLLGDKLANEIAKFADDAKQSSGASAEAWLKKERGALEDAQKKLQAELAGSTPKQKSAIEAELRTINSQLASVNRSITTNIAAQISAIKSAAKANISSAASTVTSAFSQLINDARSAFEKETQDYVDKTLGPQFFQGGLLNPHESQLASMQAQDTAQSLQDSLTAAQKQLADDMNGALEEHVVDLATGNSKDIFGPKGTQAQIDADNAAIASAKRAIYENNLSIQATADRTAEDKAYADAVNDYQQQRSLAESAMTKNLTELGKNIANGSATIGALDPLLAKFGVSLGDVPADQLTSDMGALTTATSLLAKVMLDEAARLAALGDAKDAAAIQKIADTINWQAPPTPTGGVTGGLGGAAGYFMLNPIPKMASGGDVLRDGLIYAHKGERVQAADVVRGSGGGGAISITVVAPNYVGDHADLARALKHESVLEAVGTAVGMSSRRGHIRQGDIRP